MRRFQFFLLTALSTFAIAAAPLVSVKTADDATVTASLNAIQDGKLVLESKNAQGTTQPASIPLEDVVEMTVKDAGAPPSTLRHTTAAPGAFTWQIRLAGDDQLTAPITAWTEKKIVVRTGLVAAGSLNIPVEQLRELWVAGKPEQIKQAKALQPQAALEDTVFAITDGQVLAVQGVVSGLEVNQLRIRFNDQDRRIGLDRLVGVMLGGPNAAKAGDTSFRQRVKLTSGDTISGSCLGLSDGSVELRTLWGDSLQIPLRDIASMQSINSRLVYLSDLPCAAVDQTPYLDRIMPYQLDKSLTGGPLTLSDGTYSKGIAVHARCVLSYDLAGKYDLFRTKVGFQQPEGKVGRASVRVLGDDKVLFEDADAHGDQPPAELKLNLTGVSRLTLQVDFGKGQDVGARVVWANARLLRSAATPTTQK